MKPSDYQPSSLADVLRDDSDGRATLVFVREFRHPCERVWSAITESSQIEKWAPWGASRDLNKTGAAILQMNDGSSDEPINSVVNRLMPNELLEYTVGDDVLCWELEAIPGGTRLTLRHTVSNPDMMDSFAAGWHVCLDIAELLMDGIIIGPIIGKAAVQYCERVRSQYRQIIYGHSSDGTSEAIGIEESPKRCAVRSNSI